MESTRKGKHKEITPLHIQIMESMIASFKIEGIIIPRDVDIDTLKKIEFNQGK